MNLGTLGNCKKYWYWTIDVVNHGSDSLQFPTDLANIFFRAIPMGSDHHTSSIPKTGWFNPQFDVRNKIEGYISTSRWFMLTNYVNPANELDRSQYV